MADDVELWRDVPGYFGRYRVSNLGRVQTWSRRGVRIPLRARAHQQGYLHVTFYRRGKRAHPKVHRLVAEAFVENPENKPEVNHIDGNRTNNRADNLEWADRSDQMRHVYHTLGTSNLNREDAECPF